MVPPYAFVTLITSDAYLPGALALAAALKDLHPSPPISPEVEFQTVCLVTPETVDVSSIKLLRRAYDIVIGVEVITQLDAQRNLTLLGRPDLNTVLTKLHVFRLTQYSKIVFLDADVLPIRSISHLFTLPHEFSAVPDVGWPDIFNSGVLVLTPGEDRFNSLQTLLQTKGTWDGGDQGILNEWRGGDWNRLSFTYNTTPSAAYTYAPAYERFGSQINALHFIGANKPWDSLPYRSPGSSSADNQVVQDDRPPQAYDYHSLVDKWYAVYDRHYRAESIAPTPDIEIKRYTSAWDQGAAQESITQATVPTKMSLGLGELRRIAVEGISASPILGIPPNERRSGDGEYRSLPLEGRIDLMRPRTEKPVEVLPTAAVVPPKSAPPVLEASTAQQYAPSSTEGPDLPATPPPPTVVWQVHVPDGSPVRMYTLPTPAPHELPDAPHFRALALPPSMPPTPSPHTRHPVPQVSVSRSEHPSPPQTGHPPPEDFTIGVPENIAKYLASIDQLSPRAEQRRRRPQKHEQHLRSRSEERRPASPPLVAWNPAVEPPPKDAPPASPFLADAYFQNVWDRSPSKAHFPEDHPWRSPSPDTGAFFEEPPPSDIPQQLILQGHYSQVTGEQEIGATPSPDRSKVKRIFPWEERPRQPPRRQFPSSEPPLPGTFVEPSPSPTGSDVLSTPERQIARGPIPSPLSGLPSTLNYANVWDSVPSIQRYASRLARPSPPVLLAPPFEVGRRRRMDTFRNWPEKAEVSSRDADDEDNADESNASETGDESLSQQSPGRKSGSGSEGGTYRRRSSISSRSPRMRKEYVSVAVQTDKRDMQSKKVQVDMTTVPTSPSLQVPHHRKADGGHSVHHLSSGTASPIIGLGLTTEPEVVLATPPVHTKVQFPFMTLPAGSRTSRDVLHPTISPTRSPVLPSVSTIPRPPTFTETPPRAAMPAIPGSSTRTLDSPSLASPPSSIGPLSPADGMPVPLPPRKGARVWDPARGVELLRRGSEEVLTRFLKMGSWEDDPSGAHHEPPH